MSPAPRKPVPAGRRAELEAAFLAALGPLRQKLRRAFSCELAAFGLSRALAAPLMIIAKNDGIRQHELAECLDVEGPSVVRPLDQLCADGLVTRATDATDQRARTLHLTEAGRDLARRAAPVMERRRSQLLATASDKDIEACLRVFNGFITAAERDGGDALK